MANENLNISIKADVEAVNKTLGALESRLKQLEEKARVVKIEANIPSGLAGKLEAIANNAAQAETALKGLGAASGSLTQLNTAAQGVKAFNDATKKTAGTSKKTQKETLASIASLETLSKKYITAMNKIQTARTRLDRASRAGVTTTGIDADLNAQYRALLKQQQVWESMSKSGTVSTTQYKEQLALFNDYEAQLKNIEARVSKASIMAKKFGETANRTIGLDKLASKATTWYDTYERQINGNSRILSQYQTLQSKLSTGDFSSLKEANEQFAMLRTNARSAGVEVNSFATKFGKTFGSRLRSAMAGYGVFAMQGVLTDIFTNSLDVDTAMTELKKVTDATNKEYDAFLKNAESRAQKIGATLADVVSATADYGRLGFDIQDATSLADSALIYKNVGDDVEDIDTATKSLISTMQGFGIAASESMSIVDMFNEVSNNYASSAGDIGDITMRSAASMAAAGNTLEQTIALGVTANEVQQDADTVGTALKTNNIVFVYRNMH